MQVLGSADLETDTSRRSFRVHFRVTNTSSSADYFTIVLPEAQYTAGASGRIAGYPSPEFGLPLAAGESGRMWLAWDITDPSPRTYEAVAPLRSERTGRTVRVPIKAVVLSAPSGLGTITGRVADGTGILPAGATVELTRVSTKDPTRLAPPQIDPGGRYSKQVAPGTYAVRADAPGLSGQTKAVEVGAGQSIAVDFTLAEALPWRAGQATTTGVSFPESVWSLSGSADLGTLATAPMVHNNQQGAGAFYGVAEGRVVWTQTFPQIHPSRSEAASFQAADLAVSVSGDGRYAAAMDWNGKVHLINQADGRLLWSTDAQGERHPLYPSNSPLGEGFYSSGATAFSPDGATVAVGGSNGRLTLFSVASGAPLWSQYYGGEVRALRFTPDGTRLAVGAGDWALRMVKASDGTELWRGSNQFWPFLFIAMNSNGTLVGAGGKDGVFTLWDAQSGAARWSKSYYGAFVTGAGIAPDGGRVVVSDWGYGVSMYDGGGNLLWFRRFSQAVASMTADGKLVFVAESDLERRTATFHLLDETGTTIWSSPVDLAQYCRGNISPFPQGQFIGVRLAPEYSDGVVKAAAGCIGGSVLQIRIPVRQE